VLRTPLRPRAHALQGLLRLGFARLYGPKERMHYKGLSACAPHAFTAPEESMHYKGLSVCA